MILVTTPGNGPTRRRSAAGSRSCSLPTGTRSPGCGRVEGIAARIDAGGLRWDIGERELLTDTAAIHEGAMGGDLRGGAAAIPES
jgi:hypothetical protein